VLVLRRLPWQEALAIALALGALAGVVGTSWASCFDGALRAIARPTRG
jgi:hypothetical protein